MKLSLIHYMIFRTKLSALEVERRLAEETEPEKFFRPTGFFFNKKSKPFEGAITGADFKVTPIIQGRNSFVPVIYGEVEPTMGGTIIHIKMRVHRALFAVLGFWPSLGLLLFLVVQLDEASNISDGHGFLLFSLCISTLMYITFCLFFGESIKPYKKQLAKLWEASLE